MSPETTIYEELGVPTVVNGAGTKTRIGGSRIRPAARDAMAAASDSFVRLSDLQARASERIAEVTGAETGYVTCGAAAGLTLAAAACLAGDDPARMAALPDTTGIPDEIVIPRTHRIGYDRAFRAAGARIVDVGTNDRRIGTGAGDVEPWELERAITEETVAVGYVAKPDLGPDLAAVVEVAHREDVPVIVDAAAELPPTTNLARFVETGADLVAFSGGKAIRGPQPTGILAGREAHISSVALQHLDMHATDPVWDPPTDLVDRSHIDGIPRQGIGRSMKVGKEELVGLLVALDEFIEEDHDARREEWAARSRRIAEAIGEQPGVDVEMRDDGLAVAPEVEITVDPAILGRSASDLVLALRRETPRVFVGADHVESGRFSVNPMCLSEDEATYLSERVLAQCSA